MGVAVREGFLRGGLGVGDAQKEAARCGVVPVPPFSSLLFLPGV